MDKEDKSIKKHGITLVDGESMTITAVKNVPSFESNEVEITLQDESLRITGENMEIDRLDIAEETLILTGKVKSITYHKGDLKKNFFRRLFK